MKHLTNNLTKNKTDMNKPLIGVLAHNHNGNRPGFGNNAAYIEFARKFGDVLLIDPACERVLDIDLLLLPGGRDVNPVRYNEAPSVFTQPSDPQYEWFYTKMFPKYMEKIEKEEMAVYAICAGLQQINSFFGGAINQDIDQVQSTKFRGELVDTLQLIRDNQLFEVPEEWITGKKHNSITKSKVTKNAYLKTNSLHHQGVYDHNTFYHSEYHHTISNDMVTMAINKDFGNVEVMRHKELPIIAEQAHPEERFDPDYTVMCINYLLSRVKA